ncbi:MAG: hypothetical protein ACLR7U_09635 [Ruthenibacterium lactatiformans]
MIFVGFGWAKPVPIAAATNFRHPRRIWRSPRHSPSICCWPFVYDLQAGYYPGTQGWIFVSGAVQMVWTNITLA